LSINGIWAFQNPTGIPPYKNFMMVIDHAGGYGKCTFTKRDAINHIDKYRREKLSNI
jgi:hypothetical protein